ncbi:MAG TPA: ATP-binding protein [Polyangiaceae bacterium]|nr:ATP-binding protein [Polyangiaceae bacterium]
MDERAEVAPIAEMGSRAASAETSERARLFELAVSRSPLACMCVSAKTGRYAFVNPAFAELVGRSHAELSEADPYEVWLSATHPDDLEVEREALNRIGKGEISSYRLDKRIVREGVAHWVTVDLNSLRDDEGRLEYVFAHFRETQAERGAVAARERLEAQLRQAQKLGALGKLAGGVAHDFNNRLVIIMGYAELLKRGLPDESPLVGHADMVLGSAERASELTRQLLAYSQRQVLSPRSFDLNETVERMRRLLSRLIGDDVQFDCELAAAQPIFSDPGQIEQVIMNLVLNARDAMPQGGRLCLSTADVAPSRAPLDLPRGDYVALSVRDTGTGIEPEVLPHIFEPFFTTKELGKGSGLGLSTVLGIVKQSGGTVEVESRSGEGTSFTLYLPRATEQPLAPRYVSEAALPASTPFETVLVVDDDDGVRQLMSDVLALRAYRVLNAKNGRHALGVVEEHAGDIHLLVTDVVMPEMGGLELAQRLRRRYPGIRVLFVSGYSDDPEALTAPKAPHTHFLPKPFAPGELTRLVCAILEQRAL